jgi:hypothetical protein
MGGSGPDHPLADPERAKELLDTLPPFDPPKALEEIRDWIDSVMRTEGFCIDDRIGLIMLLDESAQPFHRTLLGDYLAAPRVQKFHEQRQWTAASLFWRELGFAYLRCLGEVDSGTRFVSSDLVAAAACRGLRAAGQHLKWLQLRYGPLDDNAWTVLSNLYRFAMAHDIDRHPIELYPGVPGQTTPERELLKVLMFWIAAPDTLSPQSIEIAERLTGHFAPVFLLERGTRRVCTHCFDLDGRRPPGRAPVGAAGPTLLFFGPGDALHQMDRTRKVLESGAFPEDIALDDRYEPAALLETLEHFVQHWVPNTPERRFVRHKIQARLTVINNLQRLMGELDHGETPDFEGIESWLIEDVSAGGFAAVIPELKPEWIRVGALIGTRPEGVGRWGVGIIRRLKRDAQNQGYVGVQTLSREAHIIKLKPVGSVWGGGLTVDNAGYLSALWFADGGEPAGEMTLLIPATAYSHAQSLQMLRCGETRLLSPLGLRERGDDYALAQFRVMPRENVTSE